MDRCPASSGISNTELFPLYALTVIALSVLSMTGTLTVERRLASRKGRPIVAGQPSGS